MSSELDKLRSVLTHYDLGDIRTWQRIERGYVNQSWILQTPGGRVVLRCRHPDLGQPDLVEAQHALIQHLFFAGFPAPQIVMTHSATTFVHLNGKIFEVHRHIPGVMCDESNPAHLEAAAETLARYHLIVEGFDHPALHPVRERYGPGRLARLVGRLRHDADGVQSRRSEQLIAQFEAHVREIAKGLARLQDLPQCIIHGDYYSENLICEQNRIVGVVDYDQAQWSQRALEIAEAMIYFARERSQRFKHIVYGGAMELDVAGRFLAAYKGVIGLAAKELEALPYLIRTIWMCAALDPPLLPRLRLDRDECALSEALVLANWARAHAGDIEQMAFDV